MNREPPSPDWTWPPLSAAVLAGGASRRMGEDKAFLTLTPDGRPVIASVIETVRLVSDDVFVVSPDRPGYGSLGVPIVPDRTPRLGPIGGIVTALEIAQHGYCMVVSCDLPFLNSDLLAWMAGQPRDYQLLLPMVPRRTGPEEDSTPQPLHAIYARDCLPAIREQIAAGDLRLTNLAARLQVRSLVAATLRTIDPALDSFFNMNAPDDAQRAAELASAAPKNS